MASSDSIDQIHFPPARRVALAILSFQGHAPLHKPTLNTPK
jgi:hypothetical protein